MRAKGAMAMEDERGAKEIVDATELFAELREQANLEALSLGRLDSIALGVAEEDAPLSEEEYLDRSG